MLIGDILEDETFVRWLKSRRYKAKVDKLIFYDTQKMEEITNEEDEEASNF